MQLSALLVLHKLAADMFLRVLKQGVDFLSCGRPLCRKFAVHVPLICNDAADELAKRASAASPASIGLWFF